MSPSNEPNQFRIFPVLDQQPVECSHDDMDHDLFPCSSGRSESENAEMLERNAYVPVNYISPDACALLAAAEASAARRADALDAGVMELDVNGSGVPLQSALNGCSDPERVLCLSMAPPKRFYRRVWESMSMQLLDRSAHTAS